MPKTVYEEVIHALKADLVISATTLDHLLIMTCCEKRVPIVAAVFTEEHRQQTRAKVMKCLWSAFLDEKSSHHQPALCLYTKTLSRFCFPFLDEVLVFKL